MEMPGISFQIMGAFYLAPRALHTHPEPSLCMLQLLFRYKEELLHMLEIRSFQSATKTGLRQNDLPNAASERNRR